MNLDTPHETESAQSLKNHNFKAIVEKENIISVGKNHKKNMKKRINKKNKVANAPPAYEAEHNIDVICPSIDVEEVNRLLQII